MTFGERLNFAFQQTGRLCVGIDPHPWLLSKWELTVDAAGVREFGLRAVEAVHGVAAIVKPQVSFFERFGSEGFHALERVIREARDAGLIVIADAKRGDIGTTMDSYAAAWLHQGSPLESDALTVAPYLGLDSLESTRLMAHAHDKGLFVLAATSNPEAEQVQSAYVGDQTLASHIVEGVAQWNDPGEEFGSMGVVVGATLDLAARGISREGHETVMPVLAPGFGAQGAQWSSVREIYGELTPGVIVSESRSLLEAGPGGLRDAVAHRQDDIARLNA